MKLKKLITFFIPKLFICLIILGIILAPKSAIKAAKDGISIWINILMPSLLPFIIIQLVKLAFDKKSKED